MPVLHKHFQNIILAMQCNNMHGGIYDRIYIQITFHFELSFRIKFI